MWKCVTYAIPMILFHIGTNVNPLPPLYLYPAGTKWSDAMTIEDVSLEKFSINSFPVLPDETSHAPTNKRIICL